MTLEGLIASAFTTGVTWTALSVNMAAAKGLYNKFLKSDNKYLDYAGKAAAVGYFALSSYGGSLYFSPIKKPVKLDDLKKDDSQQDPVFIEE